MAAMTDKEKTDLRRRREKYLADRIEEVRVRMLEPYTAETHDLILYQQQYARGVRLADIPHLIRKAVERAVSK